MEEGGLPKKGCTEVKNKLSELPEELLSLVVERLCFPDLFRFNCVCNFWRYVCNPLHLGNHLPWLMVPFDHSNSTPCGFSSFNTTFDETGQVGFYSVADGKIHKAELPEISNRRICASFAGGWLMTVHENSEVQLFNPLTASSSLIHLPPLTKFPLVLGMLIRKRKEEDEYPVLCYEFTHVYSTRCYTSTEMRDRFIHKIASSSSCTTKGTVIVAIQGRYRKLAFYQIGGDVDVWTLASSIVSVRDWFLWDVTFYKGKVYAVHYRGSVSVFHLLEEGETSRLTSLRCEETISGPLGGRHKGCKQFYILESSSGDLLLVCRRTELLYHDGNYAVTPHRTVDFKVFKLDFGTPKEWLEVESLGDHSLFLGYNSSFSIPSTKFFGCKPNCIYFTDNFNRLHAKEYAKECGGNDLGIFNLQDGTIVKLLCPTEDLFVMPPPTWFAPH